MLEILFPIMKAKSIRNWTNWTKPKTPPKNDGTINISKTNATADRFLSNAQSNAHIVNVASQAALSKEFSVGLTFDYNAMNKAAF